MAGGLFSPRRKRVVFAAWTSERPTNRSCCAKACGASRRASATRLYLKKSRAGEKTTELWQALAKEGYLGISIPEAYGGGGLGIAALSIVCEELAAEGCPLILLVVSPAIAGTVIALAGTAAQKSQWLPGLAAGTKTIVFALTEPDAGSNSHNVSTTATRDGDHYVLSGQKHYISSNSVYLNPPAQLSLSVLLEM